MKQMIIDGNEACSQASYLFSEAAGIYPITPSSPMAEAMDRWSSEGKTNIFDSKVKVIEMQSEAGASGLVHGLLRSGILTTTFTASQGLLLMIPNMYKIAGEMLPGVIHVAARSLSTHALSIFGDHQDIYATRMTGFNMLASSNVEQANHLAVVAHLSAIEASLPFLHFFDGFRTSHEINKVNILERDDIKKLINIEALNKFKAKNNKVYGTNQNDDIYFQATEVRNIYYDKVPSIVNKYMEHINKITGCDYKPFNYYGDYFAKKVIIAMGSVCNTIKEVIDNLKGVGLIEVHLYRPFSKEYLINVLPKTVKSIAVLDRTKEFGSASPLYLDVLEALKDLDITVVGGRYGLSGKDTTPSLIKAVYDSLDNPINNFTIGITDDVTNLSLDAKEFKTSNSDEMLVFGYGSDGSVSASKSLIKLIGKNTNKYVQGYFQYDSKKSGGVTISHLRFNDSCIKSTYYVENPRIVVVTKDTYLNDFEVLNNIKENGIFLLNTNKNEEELLNYLSDNVKATIINKNIKFYTINANELIEKVGLKNKISTIIEVCLIYLLNVDFDKCIEDLKKEIKERFKLKGEEVINSNLKVIDDTIKNLNQITLKGNYEEKPNPNYIDVYLAIRKRLGNKLPVSSFLSMQDGGAIYNKKDFTTPISDVVANWRSSNCIKCNMCSFICPHSVIRPFVLSEEEYNKAPEYVKKRCKDNYIIGISVKNCTGCGLCIKNCLAKEKALDFEKYVDVLEEQQVFDYLVENVTCKEPSNNVKNSQFKMPKIEFSGACAGCGQPAYIKLLTQLFGDEMMIVNATGCSSIYGGDISDIPYKTGWASSLFEDNAEYGFGYLMADKINKEKIINIMSDYGSFDEYINNYNNYEITKKYYDTIDYDKYPLLKPLKENIIAKNIWIIGGDGWAYDIGFSGIDHIMSTNERVRILVLDTQVYSNTGGQASKATPKGSIALFASNGKENNKKDLARMMMSYPNAYVAQVSLGANPMQLINAFKEANDHNGPSIVIAYAPCISHGIVGGMINSIDMEREAVNCGYFPIFRYNNLNFKLDCNPNFDLYEEFLNKQTRYNALSKVNPDYKKIFEQNKQEAIARLEYYKNL